MEEDREAANLGPELPPAVENTAQQAIRQPSSRFVGRRTAEERAAARNRKQPAQDGTLTALSSPKSLRPPRALNQIPDELLNDPQLKEALSHLPPNYNFEIPKTIHRIRTSGKTKIALQFPEGLLMYSLIIADILTAFCPGTEYYVMGDVTYGACCIDDFTARALGCEILVHYGHSCLVPIDTTKGILTLYVFVTIGIDVEHLMATIERNFQAGKKIALVGTIQFNATLHAIVPRLRQLGFEPILPRSAPLSAGEILGCTAPTLTARSAVSASNKSIDEAMTADMLLYVGDGRFHLEAALIASPTLRGHTYRYDPYSRKLTHEGYDHEEMHELRGSAIRTARKTLKPPKRSHPIVPLPSQKPESALQSPISTLTPSPPHEPLPSLRSLATLPWGIILGTLGRQGNPHTLSLITTHLQHLGIPTITLLLSEISPQKLALMSRDVGVWVQVACPRLSIDWGYAFERPLLSPYEAMVVLGLREGGWRGEDGEGEAEDEGVAGVDAKKEVAVAGEVSGNKRAYPTMADTEVGVYPMDFYSKAGLGRTRAEDVPMFEEIEVR